MQAEQDLVVLVMDPLDEDTKLIAATLEKTGFGVTICSSGSDVSCASGERQRPVLLIVDAATPGLRLAEWQSRNPGVRVLVIGSEKALDHMPYGPLAKNRWLKKPFRRSRFLGSVLDALSVKTSAA